MRAAAFLVSALVSALASADVPRDAWRHRQELTREARQAWGLTAPVATFAAQIHQESRWRSNSISPVGAQGMTQFMPATTRWIAGAYPRELSTAEPFNPVWAMRALVIYDRHLWERIKAATVCDRMAMALSAYNGGLRWLWRDQKLAASKGADSARWFDQVERFNAGRHAAAYQENRGYPRMILFSNEPRYIAAGWGQGSCA